MKRVLDSGGYMKVDSLFIVTINVNSIEVWMQDKGPIKADLANALAKCLHSPLIGHELQFGLLFVQKTCMISKNIVQFTFIF